MDAPTPELLTLVTHLRLVSAEQARRTRRRAVRLASGLPLFDSVWIDAFAQARLLTAFQAAELHAGRGADLEVGPYVLRQPLGRVEWAACFVAQDRDTGEKARLAVLTPAESRLNETQQALERLVRLQAATAAPGVLTLSRCGRHGDRLWVASRWFPAKSAQQWMFERGRFPPSVAHEIARQTASSLAGWESCGQLHGDLMASQLFLDLTGRVWLCWPGLRNLLRPTEGYTSSDLPAECYDHFAPERVALNGQATNASEVYACGALWWRLLTGRSLHAGATGLAKMRLCQTGRIPPIGDVAPDTPAALAAAIDECLARDPDVRPPSFASLAERIGASSGAGRRALRQALGRSRRSSASLSAATRTFSRTPQGPLWLTAMAGCAMTVLVALWPHLSRRPENATSPVAQRQTAADIKTPAPDVAIAKPPRKAPSRPEVERLPASGGSTDGVRLAAYTESVGGELELAPDQAGDLASLAIADGQVVRGRRGRRLTLRLPPQGWTIDAENVRFENIDFISQMAGSESSTGEDPPALIHVRAWRTTFHGCSFQVSGTSVERETRSAIRLDCHASPTEQASGLPTAELTISDCVFKGVAAAVLHTGSGALVVDVSNSLHLGPGPLFDLQRPPSVDEPVAASLSHVTVRGGSAALRCMGNALEDEPGQIAVRARDCAFVPTEEGSLLEFVGSASPARLLQAIEWTGQGCVVPRSLPLALWRKPSGAARAAAEDSLRVEGLVRTDVGFAGLCDQGPQASRIVRWQAPLRSTEPPGITDRPLFLPLMKPK